MQEYDKYCSFKANVTGIKYYSRLQALYPMLQVTQLVVSEALLIMSMALYNQKNKLTFDGVRQRSCQRQLILRTAGKNQDSRFQRIRFQQIVLPKYFPLKTAVTIQTPHQKCAHARILVLKQMRMRFEDLHQICGQMCGTDLLARHHRLQSLTGEFLEGAAWKELLYSVSLKCGCFGQSLQPY